MRKKWYFIAPAAVVGIVLFSFIGGELVMRLWNWLLPSLFGWRTITFWQGLGLLALCRILFGGLGRQGHNRSNWRRRVQERKARRWAAMTPEEKNELRNRMRGVCGFDPAPSESKGG